MSTDPTLPADLAAEVKELKRRLDNLERSPRLPFSSTRGGAFIFQDTSGNVRRAMGNVTLDGSIGGITAAYGDFLYGDGGAIIIMAREGDRGVVYPDLDIPLHSPASVNVTSGTFQTLWESYTNFPAHEVIHIEMAVQSDAGTTGEIRLIENASNQVTSVASIPAAYNGVVGFEWLHPAPTGLYDPRVRPAANMALGVQVRRTAGAGNVIAFPPRQAHYSSKFMHPNAATNGHPVVS